MAASPSQSHRYTMSTSNSLIPPSASSPYKQRRMTSPSLPPPAPLDLPEPISNDRRDNRRPPSPLRKGVTLDSLTGELSEDGSILHDDDDDDDDDRSWGPSHSPSPSMAKFATNFAQRVGSLVSNISPRTPGGMPTDEELEAQAEREREMSRREAERILTREAQERKMVEERVLALLDGSRESPNSLPPPPSRAQTMPDPPSPSSSQKESSGWFSAVKSKLTPTKEPLTPAQQIIQDTKAREKEKKKNKEKEWPASGNGKFGDPAFLNLSTAAVVTPQRYPVPSSPTSPTPVPRPLSEAQPSLSPSPMRSVDSPSREAPPFYAQFNSQGTLDVSASLLVIARRFEKLERWTVGHVRALEERMSDVERWLVDKEKEKEDAVPGASQANENTPSSPHDKEIGELRDELVEMQGRISELGREMAKFATAPSNLSSGPTRTAVAATTVSPLTSTPSIHIPARSLPIAPVSTPRAATTPVTQSRAQDASSPPLTSTIITTASARTRLPYPTGDYTSPPGSVLATQGPFSPTNSPPSSLNEATRKRPMSIAGLPTSSDRLSQSVSAPSGLPRSSSPVARTTSPLSPPNPPALRPSSASPTPRKRYTVALGGSLAAPGQGDDRGFYTTSPVSTPDVTADEADSSDANGEGTGQFADDTIGKATSRLSGSPPRATHQRKALTARPSPSSPRMRAQSSYGPPSANTLFSPSPSPVTPLRPRMRSRSTDRFGLGISDLNFGNKFVDPLVVRKQTKEAVPAPKTPKVANGRGKVPIGELVAFFDGDK